MKYLDALKFSYVFSSVMFVSIAVFNTYLPMPTNATAVLSFMISVIATRQYLDLALDQLESF